MTTFWATFWEIGLRFVPTSGRTETRLKRISSKSMGVRVRSNNRPSIAISVTRLGDLLDFGQLLKAFVQQLISPNLPHC